MNQKPSRIKSIVEAAIRMLDEGGWNPSHSQRLSHAIDDRTWEITEVSYECFVII